MKKQRIRSLNQLGLTEEDLEPHHPIASGLASLFNEVVNKKVRTTTAVIDDIEHKGYPALAQAIRGTILRHIERFKLTDDEQAVGVQSQGGLWIAENPDHPDLIDLVTEHESSINVLYKEQCWSHRLAA